MNYIQRIYDLLTEAVQVSESNRASKLRRWQIRKRYTKWKKETGAEDKGADGSTTRGKTGWNDDDGNYYYKGKAGEPGTGKGGVRQQVHDPMFGETDYFEGAHSGDTSEFNNVRGERKKRLTSTPKKERAKILSKKKASR
jgi:hypothetical protein